MHPQDETRWRESLRNAAPYLGLGMQLALSVLLFFFIGWWCDGEFGTDPYGMLIGLAVGIAGGMTKFIRTVTSPEFRRDETERDEHH